MAKLTFPTISLLSSTERMLLLDVIDALAHVTSSDEFVSFVDGQLQVLFPHKRFVCGIGNISGDRVKPYRLLSHHFPQAYIEELTRSDGTIDSPLMRRWRAVRKPVLVELDRDLIGKALAYIARIRKYGFRNAAVHGQPDLHGGLTSYFSFVDIPGPLGPRHAYLLELLVPHLHGVLTRIIAGTPEMTRSDCELHEALSERQKEILYWICQGKTYSEIGEILGLSTDTIKYHIARIFHKLSVSNRAHAVIKALNLRLIEL